ncbi:hypothetical protein ACWGCW_00985 [Streptomyces sp. NPDC054933]
MTVKAARHDLADRPFHGAPRTLPTVLLCAASERWCGRHWTANTRAQYEQHTKTREAHETLCVNRAQLTQP